MSHSDSVLTFPDLEEGNGVALAVAGVNTPGVEADPARRTYETRMRKDHPEIPTDVPICSRCGGENDRLSQRYCKACHATVMREWRAANPLADEAKRRANARAYAKEYVKKGWIKREPCRTCGSSKSEMHHPNHDHPLDVVWLCRDCHESWHRHERDVAIAVFEDWLETMKAPAPPDVSCETNVSQNNSLEQRLRARKVGMPRIGNMRLAPETVAGTKTGCETSVRLSITVSTDLFAQLKLEAVAQGSSLSGTVATLLSSALNNADQGSERAG